MSAYSSRVSACTSQKLPACLLGEAARGPQRVELRLLDLRDYIPDTRCAHMRTNTSATVCGALLSWAVFAPIQHHAGRAPNAALLLAQRFWRVP